ncbi:MAG: Ankyrin repeat (many copies) [Gammaproteobacteria bacterium]|jgi:ankyrin repeat protein|nr:Ankyrin repeat (many copies) [Gammaproteobacteria bacterium]
MKQDRSLFKAAVENNRELLKEAINQKRLNVNMRCEETGATALLMAVRSRQGGLESIEFLLGQGADWSIEDKRGVTPLHSIILQFQDRHSQKSKEECIKIAELLLKKGADPDAKNKFGKTPFSCLEKTDTESEQQLRNLLEQYRKQSIAQQKIFNSTPPLPPERNNKPVLPEQEANLVDVVGENTALLLSKQGTFSVNGKKEEYAKELPRRISSNCTFM